MEFTTEQISNVCEIVKKELTDSVKISKTMKKAIVENVQAALELENIRAVNECYLNQKERRYTQI